jgi:ribosomal 30S subunit maturation factor RimM
VVKGDVDGRPRELLIPAVGDVVLSIDIAGKTMVVELPEGLQDC